MIATDPKTERFFTAVKEQDTDVFLIQDLGNNWSCQPKANQWSTRVHKYLGRHRVRTRCSHNIRDVAGAKERSQTGGTGVLTVGKLAFNAISSDSDPSGLGRWTWARFRGENGENLRVASIYRPTYNPTGCLSVWNQHKAYFQSINDDRDPRKAFMEDLEKEAKAWLTTGDHIIIGGDVNDDIFGDNITELFQSKLHMNDLTVSTASTHKRKPLLPMFEMATAKLLMVFGELSPFKSKHVDTSKWMPSFLGIMQFFGQTTLTLHLAVLFKNPLPWKPDDSPWKIPSQSRIISSCTRASPTNMTSSIARVLWRTPLFQDNL